MVELPTTRWGGFQLRPIRAMVEPGTPLETQIHIFRANTAPRSYQNLGLDWNGAKMKVRGAPCV